LAQRAASAIVAANARAATAFWFAQSLVVNQPVEISRDPSASSGRDRAALQRSHGLCRGDFDELHALRVTAIFVDPRQRRQPQDALQAERADRFACASIAVITSNVTISATVRRG
jgi:hypothetical protein